MSGHFEKGAWIEPGKEPLPDNIEIGVKVKVDTSELDLLDKMMESHYKEFAHKDYYRLMDLEIKVQRAGFRQRLWYLLTGKL